MDNKTKFIDQTEQGHGHAFENMVKGGFPGSSNSHRSATNKFDIEKKFDKSQKLPTSVKTTKSNTITLADARTAFSIDEEFRIVAIKYKQQKNNKVPEKLYEFEITKENWNKIKGQLPIEKITEFHNDIKNVEFGKHNEGRKEAKEIKKELKENYESDIILNPKIDSKNQRRLQASITIENLSKHVEPTIINAENNTIMYRGVSIGKIESLPRNLKENKK